MRVSRRIFLTGVVAAMCLSSAAAGAEPDRATTKSDQAAAARVLRLQWKQLSRRAEIIFSGTALSTSTPEVRTDRVVSAVELSFRVDRAIAGVAPGKVLTIHEWAGAWSQLRPIRRGDRILLFLYPPSRLGLTSPVGGSQGQIRLDATGQNVVSQALPLPAGVKSQPRSGVTGAADRAAGSVSLTQLERAIRAAREE